jgi:PhnB protein
MKTNNETYFAPELSLTAVAPAVEFYKKAFGVEELLIVKNEDGSVHVAELSLQGAIFHLHQEMPGTVERGPEAFGGTTVIVGVFVDDPDALMDRAVAAGALVLKPMKSHEYGYRQGTLEDPFGHHWTFQKVIGEVWKGIIGPGAGPSAAKGPNGSERQ